MMGLYPRDFPLDENQVTDRVSALTPIPFGEGMGVRSRSALLACSQCVHCPPFAGMIGTKER